MTSDQAQQLWVGYFPMKIYIVENDSCMTCNTPQDIPNNKTIKVLEWAINCTNK